LDGAMRSVVLSELDGTLLVGWRAVAGGVLAPERLLTAPRDSLT